jgi:predicted lipoprotein with Yx(FWY)xxD motif
VLPASWGTISRPDGITQLTFLGRPLYTFVRDTTAGAVNGDGATAFGGVFHVARPTPTGA